MVAQWKNINENYKNLEGYKRVAWPPANEERVVREFTPQPHAQYTAPLYNPQAQEQTQQPQPTQQYQPPTAAVAPTQAPSYNNVQHNYPYQQQQPHHTPYNNNTTTPNNHNARESISPYNHQQQQPTGQQIEEDFLEPFPPQTPETPIVLIDKQFSKPPSNEPSFQSIGGGASSAAPSSYQPEWQQSQPREEPPTFNQPSQFYQQQYQQPGRYQQQPQPQPQPHQTQYQYPKPQQQQQQPQYQPQPQQQHQTTPSGWSNQEMRPQAKQEFAYTNQTGGVGVGHDEPASTAYPVYQKQFESYHKQQQQQQQHHYYQEQPPQQQHPQPQPQQYQQQQYQPPKQYSPQPQYQGQAPAPAQNQYPYQPQQPQQPYQQPPTWVQSQHLPQPYQPPTQQSQYQAPQQQQQQPQYQASSYQHPPQPQQQHPQYQQQPGYQAAPLSNQYQAPHNQQQYQTPSQTQFVLQPNQQQQFTSYSQPQQQQHQQQHPPQTQNVPHGNDQLDNLNMGHAQRGASPGIITLRKEAPISQAPAPVYTSQPAAVSFQGGNKLRGDLKWPPQEYKEAAVRENEERRQLAAGPVCRPRKVARDYTSFFAKNALSHHYPSYKVPPGTQHMTY